MSKIKKPLVGFKRISPEKITDNPFKVMENDWFLLTAGDLKNYNTMTCGWGAWGVLWRMPVVFVFVRPTRYTFEFMNRSHYFTVCFFAKRYRRLLEYCGTHSGREVDKARETGLVPLATPRGAVAFEQSRLILECRRIYQDDLDPVKFFEPSLKSNYPAHDYHRMYVGRVEEAWEKT